MTAIKPPSGDERWTTVQATDQLLEIVQEHIASFNDGDRDRFRETLSPDAVMAFRAVDRVCRGVDDICAAYWALRDHFADVHFQITGGFSTDTHAIVETIRSCNSKLNGVRVTVPECIVFAIRGGRIASISYYTDRMTELIQLGAVTDLFASDLPRGRLTSSYRPVSPRPRAHGLIRTFTRRARPHAN
ncbi:MAG TPA: nuclear transport factor 2 family protein [Chloroflexota bacterium]|nr:nuclear transport factor 2 family protein [Chloroflexota bacterium]